MSNVFDEAIQKKREGYFDEALGLFIRAIELGEETPSNVSPDPYEEAAKIYRKRKDRKGEISVLERLMGQRQQPGKAFERLSKRLIRAYELDGLIEKNGDNAVFHRGYNLPIEQCPPFLGVASIVDVETTGLSNKDDMIEIGILTFKYSRLTGEIIGDPEEYQSFNEPSCKIGAEAMKIHGISFADVEGYHVDIDAVGDILKRSDILIAHNASFDCKFLSKYIPGASDLIWYCTVNGINWRQYGFKSRKLQDLAKALKISVSGDAHRSMSDARVVFDLLQKQNPHGETYLRELISGRPVYISKSDNYQSERSTEQGVIFKFGADGSVERKEWKGKRRSGDDEEDDEEYAGCFKLFIGVVVAIFAFVFFHVYSFLSN